MENIKSYLSFMISSEYYAANVSHVHNIIEYTDITRMPDMPDYLLGVINLRGQVLPVVDARIKFGIQNTELTNNTCILVMEVNIDDTMVFVGILVDSVNEVLEINDDKISEPPSIGSTIRNEFISGVFHDNEKFIMILDMNQVFAADEIIGLQRSEENV